SAGVSNRPSRGSAIPDQAGRNSRSAPSDDFRVTRTSKSRHFSLTPPSQRTSSVQACFPVMDLGVSIMQRFHKLGRKAGWLSTASAASVLAAGLLAAGAAQAE